MENIIITLIGTTVSVITGAIIKVIERRKRKSLDYIVEEREKRKKIFQKIVVGIKRTIYKGKGKENIETYLDKLEMNLNPYGKLKKWNYALDGHIWEIIYELRESVDENAFEQKKEVLLSYLYLLIKEEGDKVKKEVNGYSKAIVFTVLVGIISIIYSFIYLFVFELNNITFLLLMLIFNCFPLVLIKYFLVDKIDAIERADRNITLDAIKKNRKKKISICVIFASTCMLSFLFWGWVSVYGYPKMILKEMQYNIEENTIHIYTELVTDTWFELETNIQKYLEYDIILERSDDNNKLEDMKRDKDIDQKLEMAIDESISIFVGISFILLIGEMAIGIIFLIDAEPNSKIIVKEIDKIKYDEGNDNKEKSRQLNLIIKKIDLSKGTKDRCNNSYLGLMHNILKDLDIELDLELYQIQRNIKNIETYERIENINTCREKIKLTLKIIDNMGNNISKDELKELQSNIQQISEGILQM